MSAREARNAIVILLDSLNRHMLGAYGGSEFATPHIDRLATRSVRFTNHYAASLPCIPARHDILCGAWDFLWRPWGSVELWEDAITGALTRAGVVSQLISDHPHLFETGGENYHVDFTAWDYQRGHEGDPWKTRFDPSFAGTPGFGRPVMPYSRSRPYFRGEEDFPGPRTMRAAAHFLREDARAHDRFFLFVDEFDPHEPFDTPEEYVRAYDPDWTGEPLIWPPYAVGAVSRGVIDARQGRQIRARYGAKLTMIDRWLGKVLDEIDAQDLWDDTLVILCTDHGHYLGEKDIWGKPAVPLYQTMSHIPLLISAPGVPAAAKDALTTSVDIFATLAELFGVTDRMRQRVHGRSLLGLLDSEATSVREWLLAGVWGREVHYIDRNIKYARAPAGANAPLSMWSNRWSTMPTHVLPRERELPLPDDRAELGRMPGSRVPVIRQLWDESDPLPFWAYARFSGNHLYDLSSDPAEEQNLAGSSKEATAIDALRSAMRSIEAPAEQFSRLGLQ
ncbi:MAG: sulfatase-like hydrolase/transferase [Alphaproteobacteria bacterium]|nr:sulfatase-like hydrolase/transferase [Alphaproteobacteria bacterium]